MAINKEIIAEQDSCPDCGNKKLRKEKGIETGNIFTLGTKFSDALGLSYPNEKGEKIPVVMGCYGIGPSRLMGTVVECLSDKVGIIWPKSIAPFNVHLLNICSSEKGHEMADKIYADLQLAGIEVLYDDREARAGEKFADADLLGMPLRVILSDKTLENEEVEIKDRTSDMVSLIKYADLVSYIKK